jgi:hypothetical protein
MPDARSITHPPKADLQEILKRFGVGTATLLLGIHGALVQLHDEPWIMNDYYDKLLALWYQWTEVAFIDTLPTYTYEPAFYSPIAERLFQVQTEHPDLDGLPGELIKLLVEEPDAPQDGEPDPHA